MRSDARAFVFAIVALLALSIAHGADGQTAGKVPRVGILLTASPGRNLDDLRRGLRDLGYVEGQTIVLEVLSAEQTLDRLPALARELVRRRVDVIVTSGPPAVRAAQNATKTIPIVMGRWTTSTCTASSRISRIRETTSLACP